MLPSAEAAWAGRVVDVTCVLPDAAEACGAPRQPGGRRAACFLRRYSINLPDAEPSASPEGMTAATAPGRRRRRAADGGTKHRASAVSSTRRQAPLPCHAPAHYSSCYVGETTLQQNDRHFLSLCRADSSLPQLRLSCAVVTSQFGLLETMLQSASPTGGSSKPRLAHRVRPKDANAGTRSRLTQASAYS